MKLMSLIFVKGPQNDQLASNKSKGRISKQMLQENKACQIFQKMNIS